MPKSGLQEGDRRGDRGMTQLLQIEAITRSIQRATFPQRQMRYSTLIL